MKSGRGAAQCANRKTTACGGGSPLHLGDDRRAYQKSLCLEHRTDADRVDRIWQSAPQPQIYADQRHENPEELQSSALWEEACVDDGFEQQARTPPIGMPRTPSAIVCKLAHLIHTSIKFAPKPAQVPHQTAIGMETANGRKTTVEAQISATKKTRSRTIPIRKEPSITFSGDNPRQPTRLICASTKPRNDAAKYNTLQMLLREKNWNLKSRGWARSKELLRALPRMRSVCFAS
jgi:hypothetical protein